MPPLTYFLWIHRIQEFSNSCSNIRYLHCTSSAGKSVQMEGNFCSRTEEIQVQHNSTHLVSSSTRDERSARTFRSRLTMSTGKVDVSVSSPVWSIDRRKSMHRWLCFFPDPRDVSSIRSPSSDESRRTLLIFFFMSFTAATAIQSRISHSAARPM